MIYDELDIEPIDMFEDLWWSFYLSNPLGMETRQPLIESFTRLDIRAVRNYDSDPHYRILFHDTEVDIYFEVSNSDDASPYISLGMHAENVLQPETPQARFNADRFLEYGKICYSTLQPLYAFAENLNVYVEMDDVQAARVTHIFWAQFFGPEFVRGVGQAVLINAPAWRNENMGDGGLLYVLAASPYLYRGPRQSWQQARDYFAQHVSTSIHWSDSPG